MIDVGSKVKFKDTGDKVLDMMSGYIVGFYGVQTTGLPPTSYIVLFDNNGIYHRQRAIVISGACIQEAF